MDVKKPATHPRTKMLSQLSKEALKKVPTTKHIRLNGTLFEEGYAQAKVGKKD